VIQNINGQGNKTAGESDSVTSNNKYASAFFSHALPLTGSALTVVGFSFIAFCKGKTITNGKQVTQGSCNPTPMGDIPSTSNMVSSKASIP
jgi:hypothetical protein